MWSVKITPWKGRKQNWAHIEVGLSFILNERLGQQHKDLKPGWLPRLILNWDSQVD